LGLTFSIPGKVGTGYSMILSSLYGFDIFFDMHQNIDPDEHVDLVRWV
jgi:hypothetical protein